jgi:hypothetical protein
LKQQRAREGIDHCEGAWGHDGRWRSEGRHRCTVQAAHGKVRGLQHSLWVRAASDGRPRELQPDKRGPGR